MRSPQSRRGCREHGRRYRSSRTVCSRPNLDAVIGGDADDGGIERAVRTAAREQVDTARVRQVHLEEFDLRDLHLFSLFIICSRTLCLSGRRDTSALPASARGARSSFEYVLK